MMATMPERPEHEKHGGGEMHSLPPETERVVAEVVARFVRRFPTPPRYHPDEWRAECLGEAWRCVADAVRTYNPAQGKWTGYLAQAVWKHLQEPSHSRRT